MRTDSTTEIVRTGGHPLLLTCIAFPIACFCGALATDLAYVATENFIWADFSAWLLAAGLGMGVIAAIVAVVDYARHRRQTRRGAWLVALGSVAVLFAALLDNLVHSRDAWTSVMPMGLLLSTLTVLIMLLTIWLSAGRDREIVTTSFGSVRR